MQKRILGKMMALRILTGLVFGLLCGPALAGGDIAGIWMTPEEDGAVLISPCADGLCGRIVWLKSPLGEDGEPVRDENNSDESLRNRALCGVEVFSGVRPAGDGWEGSWIYDPDSGGTYSLAIARGENDSLSVTGFVGLKALGRTFSWHRAPAALKRCDGPAVPSGKPGAIGGKS